MMDAAGSVSADWLRAWARAGAWAPGMAGGLAEGEEWGSSPAPGSELRLRAVALGRLLVLSVPLRSSLEELIHTEC